MAWINSDLVKYISETFPDRKVQAYHDYYTWQSSRYISVATILKDDFDIHYEYRLDNNRYVVELHLEGKYQHIDYRSFVKELRINTSRNTELKWLNWQNRSQCRCQFTATIDSWSDLVNAFKKIMQFFDPLIESAEKQAIQQSVEPYSGRKDFFENGLGQDSVCLETCSLGQLFSNPLVIPDYQRNYCWEDKQVKALWNSLKEIPQNSNYHLGTIILQKDKEGKYNIIDGQQRLVTLTLIVNELKYSGELPLLTQSFRSENSRKHIANSKWLIKQLSNNHIADVKDFYENLLYYRLLLDFYIIHKEGDDNANKYNIVFRSESSTEALKQYQSMLYVSQTQFYNWLKPILYRLSKENPTDTSQLLGWIKEIDNSLHARPESPGSLSYICSVDKYWFWRLDYYLWEKRDLYFADEDKEIVDGYVFRANRSIEHLHPQHQANNDEWKIDDIHSFGNLAMISQSFNSQQSDDPVTVKFARIADQAHNHSLQSIKMYRMYLDAQKNPEGWTKDIKDAHQEQMFDLLVKSYNIE